MKLTQSQQTTAINALYLAASAYDESEAAVRKEFTRHPELADQFKRQAEEARKLAEYIEQNG